MKADVFRSRSGYTLVELLVCAVVVLIMAFCGMFTFVRAGRLEMNLRREAYARTALAMHLERLEKMLQLANGIEGLGQLNPGDECLLRVSYPQEAGGVSFETNTIMRVRGTVLRMLQESLETVVSNRDEHLVLNGRVGRFDADFPLDVSANAGRISLVAVSNMAPFATGLVTVRLQAEVDLDAGNGTTRTKTVSADRFVRLWNLK